MPCSELVATNTVLTLSLNSACPNRTDNEAGILQVTGPFLYGDKLYCRKKTGIIFCVVMLITGKAIKIQHATLLTVERLWEL